MKCEIFKSIRRMIFTELAALMRFGTEINATDFGRQIQGQGKIKPNGNRRGGVYTPPTRRNCRRIRSTILKLTKQTA